MDGFTVRGLPRSLQRDAWWMAPDTARGAGDGPVPAVAPAEGRIPFAPLLGLVAVLVVLADVMVWHVTPGLSLIVLVAGVAMAAQAVMGAAPDRIRVVQAWAVLAVGAVPVAEVVQPVSVVILLLAFMMFCAILTVGVPGALRAMRRMPRAVVALWWADAAAAQSAVANTPRRADVTRGLRDWVLAALVGAVFVALLALANPVLAGWIEAAALRVAQPALDIDRTVFWVICAVTIWPAVRLTAMTSRLGAPTVAKVQPDQPRGLSLGVVNARSVLRALALFNLLFAVQTLTDVVYLWGGVRLPDGVTYAQYAHRGAYPLACVAVLAGIFALTAQPFLSGRPVLRAMLLVWLAQTVVLMVSALLRLDLYVDQYGLTRVRVAGFVGMGMVAAGIMAMLAQVWQARGSAWLIAALSMIAVVTFYALSLVNVAGVIARYNLDRADVSLDIYYMCGLGDGALPAVAAAQPDILQVCASIGVDTGIAAPADWREWGYRNARLRASLARIQGGEV